MSKRIWGLIGLILLSLAISGCWDYMEYEDMAQISGLGFDYNAQTQESTVTIQYPLAKRGKGGSSMPESSAAGIQWVVNSATDKTLIGTLAKLQEVVPKRLFFGYIRNIVVGEEAAKYQMMEIIDLFDRTPVMHSSANMTVAAGKAEDIIKTVDPAKTLSSSEELHSLIKFADRTGAAYPVTLDDFKEMLAIGGWEAVAPRVVSEEVKPERKDAQGGTQGPARLAEERSGILKVAGLAVFKKDRLVGWLNEKESLGLRLITGKNFKGYKVEESSASAVENVLDFNVNETDRKIKVQLDNGQPVIRLEVKIKADLRKYYRDKGPEFISAEEMSKVENILAESIRSDIEAALFKGQKDLKTDIFGFGFVFFRKFPGLWQEEYEARWPDIFPDIPVNIEVTAKVINSGTNIKKLIIK